MPWYTTDDARSDAERQAGLLDKPQTSKQVTGQGAEAPQWTAADEAMRWLNEVELAQGGANGPTIKLRAAVLTLARDVRGALSTAQKTPRDPLEIEELWDQAHELLEQGGEHGPEVHELFARLIERAHGIGV